MDRINDQLKRIVDEIKTLNLTVDSKFDSLNSKLDTFVNKTEHEIKDIRENITRLEQSQQFISDQYEKHRTEQDNIIKSHTQVSKETEELNTKVKRLEKELKEEKIKRNKLEQHGRLNQVEINGIPLKENESCKGIVLEVAKLANAKIIPPDVDVAHRLPAGGIIVAFNSRTARDEFYNNRFNLKGKTVKDLGLDPPVKDGQVTMGYIFINEGLTQETKSLLFETRKKCKLLNIPKVWTSKGIIKVKGEHHTKPIIIASMDDVSKLN